MILNNEIFIFLENAYLIKLNINGSLKELRKLPSKINSEIIVINQRILFLSRNNKLNVFN